MSNFSSLDKAENSELNLDGLAIEPTRKRGKSGKLAKSKRGEQFTQEMQVVDPATLPVVSNLNSAQVDVWISTIETIGAADLTAELRAYLATLYQRRQSFIQLKDGIAQTFALQTTEMANADSRLVQEVNLALAGLQEDQDLAESFEVLHSLTKSWNEVSNPLEQWQASIAQ